ncbi:MAG: HYR domain-containing protein [Thaumarchaeota archaeon]|nr:HYR domain-containing protein [Nitrososphaerota archaeon]
MTLVVLVILFTGSINISMAATLSHPLLNTWGTAGHSIGSFYNPQSLAIDSNGNVYVTDLGNKRVQKFDSDGTFLNAWGSGGTGAGQFNSPIGIAIGENHVFVVDSQLNKIQKFDTDGNFVTQWGKQGDGPGEFLLPNGITVNNNGTVLVVDTGNHRIQQFTSDGEFLREFGQSGTADDKFISPIGITTDSEKNIYVSDPSANKIKKFDSFGNFITSFGPNVAGFPLRAQGLQIDPEGNLYVADGYNNRVLRLASDGLTLSVFGSTGIQAGQFKIPKDVALDQYANLYVVDSNGHRIQKFGTPMTIDESQPTPEPTTEPTTESTTELTPIPGDFTRPTIIPPPDVIIEATGGLTPVSIGQASATDESGIQSLESNAPLEFPLGITTVIWTAIDGSGNMAIATQVVTVNDTIPPEISELPDITVEAKSPTQNIVELRPPAATDQVGLMSITNDSPDYFPIGETIVTWTAFDVIGNTASTTQKVIVLDTSKPKIYVPGDIFVEATSIDQNQVYLGEASVIDNGEIISITNDSPEFFRLGNTTVTWIAADASGNTITAQQQVSIVDTTAPEIIPPENIVFEATSTSTNIIDIGLPLVTDIQQVALANDAPTLFSIGDTIVNWIATDDSGNVASTSQLVTVVDSTAPSLNITKNITSEATGLDGNIVSLGEIIVEDISEITSVSNDAPETFPFGTTIVTWTVVDNYGNVATAEQTISIIDTTDPQIIPPADILIEATDVHENFVDLGQPQIDDLVDIASLTNDSPASFPIGMTTITWTVSDTSGNTASSAQVVTVVDSTIPEILAPASITIEAAGPNGSIVAIGEPTVSDTIGISSVTNDAPDVFPIGETIVTWTATDTHGNVATTSQTITVVDTISPVVTAPASIRVEATGVSTTAEIGIADATDSVGVTSITNDAPESYSVGDTIITWTSTDAAGNSASAVQTVSVVDTTPPAITAPLAITVEATSQTYNIVAYGTAMASDLVGVTSITNDAPEKFPFGLTSIIWTASDAAGNSDSAIQQIFIVDTTAPEITPPADIITEAQSMIGNIVAIGESHAIDSVEVRSITNDAPSTFSLGETIVTWIVTDSTGNSANATQLITLIDTTSPSIVQLGNMTIEATSQNENQILLVFPTASDTVSDVKITHDAPSTFSLGETIVTWTATDQDGNSASTTQTITVIDTTSPELTIPEDLIVDATGIVSIISVGQATSTDLTDPSPNITNDAPEIFPLGQTLVTWTAIDSFGNSISETQTIEVQACGKPISYYNMIEGSFDDDMIIGTNLPDLIFAYGGDDIISGEKGNDCIFGGEGDDIIFGNEGNDNLTGGEGNDIIKGLSGNDTITGGIGLDIIDGGDDIDMCNVSQASDGDLVVKCES